ncbi:ligand-binding protein, receptor family [Acetobacteraceae bacterium AT-5844]|nr:ligand-binding protein, receptor family [Acetobacteraceae bacterium AT-5844]
MTMTRRTALALGASTLLAGRTSWAQGKPELVIGELHPVTGPASFYGLVMSRTLQLLAQQATAAGGLEIGGQSYTVRVETGDDQAQATVGVAALRKLTSSNVRFIIGPLSSAVAPAIKPVIDSNRNIVQVIDGSIADGVVNGRNSFRTQANADTYNNAVIAHLKAKGVTSAAVMSDRGHQGFMMSAPRMVKAMNEAGIKVVAEEFFKIGDTDFSAQLTKMKGLQPAALVLRGYPGEGALITKQSQQLGLGAQVVWEMGAPPATVLRNIPAEQMQGVVNCTPLMTEDYIRLQVPNAVKFANAYRERFNELPSENAAFTHDSFWVLVAAMRKAGGTDPQKVTDVMRALKVSEVPSLIVQYTPYADGLLFQDGQANPPAAAQEWRGESWQAMDGARVAITTSQN